MPSVLDPPSGPPSSFALLDIELEHAKPCQCGHLLIPRRHDGYDYGVQWYWQRHSVKLCQLELPDLVCWCGLKRSEHIEGHKRP